MRRASNDHDFVFEDVHLTKVSVAHLVNSEFVHVLAVNVDALSLLIKSIKLRPVVIEETFLWKILPRRILQLDAR